MFECIIFLYDVKQPNIHDGVDGIAWKRNSHGNFTTKSAYQVLTPNFEEQPYWKHLWKWRGPQRISIFMWLASHDSLLTALRRSSWTVIRTWQRIIGCLGGFIPSYLLATLEMRNQSLFEEGFAPPLNRLAVVESYIKDMAVAFENFREKAHN